VSRDVCFAYVPETRVGDYVIVHAGFAVRIVEEWEAKQAMDILLSLPDP
jgi:hydrogenase expression/formation protein HypC